VAKPNQTHQQDCGRFEPKIKVLPGCSHPASFAGKCGQLVGSKDFVDKYLPRIRRYLAGMLMGAAL
jgi:hypothetical protein